MFSDLHNTIHNQGTNQIDLEVAIKLNWHKVGLEGPIPQEKLYKIRQWLTRHINDETYIYKEIFFCCSSWFEHVEDAVLFKTIWG